MTDKRIAHKLIMLAKSILSENKDTDVLFKREDVRKAAESFEEEVEMVELEDFIQDIEEQNL